MAKYQSQVLKESIMNYGIIYYTFEKHQSYTCEAFIIPFNALIIQLRSANSILYIIIEIKFIENAEHSMLMRESWQLILHSDLY